MFVGFILYNCHWWWWHSFLHPLWWWCCPSLMVVMKFYPYPLINFFFLFLFVIHTHRKKLIFKNDRGNAEFDMEVLACDPLFFTFYLWINFIGIPLEYFSYMSIYMPWKITSTAPILVVGLFTLTLTSCDVLILRCTFLVLKTKYGWYPILVSYVWYYLLGLQPLVSVECFERHFLSSLPLAPSQIYPLLRAHV